MPSTLAFGISLKAWLVFSVIKRDESLLAQFIQAPNHKVMFVECVLLLLEEDRQFQDILVKDLICECGHAFGRILLTKFFNCVASNYVKRLSMTGPKAGIMCKAMKLSSKR